MWLNYTRQDKPELYDIIKRPDITEDLSSMFATDGTVMQIFRAGMSKEHFAVLLLVLLFDNPDDREERKLHDPAAAIGQFFSMFVENTRNSYQVGTSTYVDEMLVGFRGRCIFKMYIPSKPEK